MFKNKKLLYGLAAAVIVIIAAVLFFGKANSSVDTGTVTTVSISDGITASGKIEAQVYTTLAWKTSGTVEKVNVKVGDQVKAGDILLSLEITSAPANIISAQADLVNVKKSLEDVLKSTLSLAKAEQDLATAVKAVEDAEGDVSKLGFRNANDDVIKKTQAQLDLANKKISDAEDAYKTYKNRPDGDSDKARALYDLSNARVERDQLIANLNWYQGTPDSLDAAKYEAALAVAQAQQADAQREIDRLKDGPDPDDVAAAQARVDAAQATVNSLYIIAPSDGEVLIIEQNPGDVVSPNEIAVDIADRSKLHIDAQVDEADIAEVKLGNPVSITMDAMPDVTLNGTVTFINPVGEKIDGLIKYSVRVELDPVEEPMLLGATADVVIQVSEARDELAVPASAVKSDEDGNKYVNLIEADGSIRQVTVQSGKSVGNLVIVNGELKAGDTIQAK